MTFVVVENTWLRSSMYSYTNLIYSHVDELPSFVLFRYTFLTRASIAQYVDVNVVDRI